MNSKFTLQALRDRGDRYNRPYTKPTIPKYSFRGQDKALPSLITNDPFVSGKVQNQYTGTKMIGVATLHKSNGVPVFSEEDAVEISRMRRG